MIDRSFGDYGKMLRAPDLRLRDVRTSLFIEQPPFEHPIDDSNRSFFVFARRGNFVLEVGGSQTGIPVPQGMAVGLEIGRPHRWRSLSAAAAGLEEGQSFELFVSSIPRRLSVLQSLDGGLVKVPPEDEPFASLIRHCVEIHILEFQNPTSYADDAIFARCAEMVLMQFVRYVRSKITQQPDAPAGLAHDEHLLRAWSAYFADPLRRWTVQALADAAGLGRTTFAQRFHKIFGAPPLQTLTDIRLEQAETMLRRSKAPLIEIAFTVGYNSEAAFVRAFHRKYGVPPGRFRTETDRS